VAEVKLGMRWKRESRGAEELPSTLRATRYMLLKEVGGRAEVVTQGLGMPKMLAIHRQVTDMANGDGPDAAAAIAALEEDWQEVT
jgi:hypothetical protein